MTLRLHIDECIDGRIVRGLEEHLLGATDAGHYSRARNLGRILVTGDDDFLALAASKQRTGEIFGGLMYVLPERAVGDVVRAIEEIAGRLEPHDIANHVEWVP